MQAFPIRTLTEADLDGIVEAAGGICAHPDTDRREDVGADYIVGNTFSTFAARYGCATA